MQKITPFLWFNDQAEEAANFYVSIFKNSKLGSIRRYGEGGPGKPGSVMTVSFTIEGQEFMGLNGGPHFKFTPAISFFVDCATQQEVNEVWEKLSAGGKKGQCGWLEDQYGVSWQIVPADLGAVLSNPDREKAARAMKAMLTMSKLDIEQLRQA